MCRVRCAALFSVFQGRFLVGLSRPQGGALQVLPASARDFGYPSFCAEAAQMRSSMPHLLGAPGCLLGVPGSSWVTHGASWTVLGLFWMLFECFWVPPGCLLGVPGLLYKDTDADMDPDADTDVDED